MQYSLSKSRYCSGLQCPKMLWLKEHKPETYDKSCMNQSVLDSGLEVGDLAMGLFGDFVEVPYDKPGEMAKATIPLMDQKVPVIAEASFAYDGCFCSVDILRRLGDREVAIYEVKSSTAVSDIYRQDAAYQYYVLESLGYQVVSCNIVHINNQYVREGTLDLQQLFVIVDITKEAKALQPAVRDNIRKIRDYMTQEAEPVQDIGMHCFEPYKCGHWKYCSRHLPTPSVFDIDGLGPKKAFPLYHAGIVSFQDLQEKGKLSDRQLQQVEHELTDCPPRIDLKSIREYLEKFTYPLYFFDFESYQPPVPPFDNIAPFKQVVFQYSLDYIEYEGGPVHHRDFLAYPGKDPRRDLAEQMCRDIPKDVCVVTYNMSFEISQINKLADLYPNLQEHLHNIRDHIVDLEKPFADRWYMNRAMQGRSSIKLVLPALFPDDPQLNYTNLEGIHQGAEASAAFKAMARMDPEQLEATRQQLLKYCGLDTYAMIKILDKLKEIAKA